MQSVAVKCYENKIMDIDWALFEINVNLTHLTSSKSKVEPQQVDRIEKQAKLLLALAKRLRMHCS